MQYLYHLTLSTGHMRKSYRNEVDDAALAVALATIDVALTGDRAEIGIDGYEASASSQGQALIITAWRCAGDYPLVTVGVARDSRSGAGLWRALQAEGRPPPAPWVAARIEQTASRDPEALTWLGDWERCIGWAWIEAGQRGSHKPGTA